MTNIWCPYHNTSAPADDFCCPHLIAKIAVDSQKKILELMDEINRRKCDD